MDNKKSNNGLIIVLIIVTTIAIFLGGYLVYDKLNQQEENPIEIVKPGEEENNVTNVEEKSSSITEFYFDSIAIVSDGKVYVRVDGTKPELDNLYGEGTYNKLVETRKNYKEYSFDNLKYNLDDNSSFKGIKLNTSNVSEVYSNVSGQTVMNNYGLILLNDDKTLSMISLYSLINGKTDVKKISNLTDIENVITEYERGGIVTYAVDKSGKKINLYDYIPKDYKTF